MVLICCGVVVSGLVGLHRWALPQVAVGPREQTPLLVCDTPESVVVVEKNSRRFVSVIGLFE